MSRNKASASARRSRGSLCGCALRAPVQFALDEAIDCRNARACSDLFGLTLQLQKLCDLPYRAVVETETFDEGMQVHRGRHLRMQSEPSKHQRRTQRIEVFLVVDLGPFTDMPRPLPFAEVEVVVTARRGMRSLTREFNQLGAHRFLPHVADRTRQPLQHDRVRLHQETQSLANVPAADVEVVADRQLDDVASRMDAEIPVGGVGVDESHVIVAVGRRKAPGSAAAFDGEQHPHMMVRLDVCDLRLDDGADSVGD